MRKVNRCVRFILRLSLISVMAQAPVLVSASPEILFPEDSGVIDITKPPYNAKGDGETDDTESINRALRDHNARTAIDRLAPWTIYFPKGEYVVSDTLVARAPGVGHPVNGVRLVGQDRDRTIIRLRDKAKGFDRERRPKPVVRTGNDIGQGNSGYSNYIQNMTIHTGQGNPGAAGIHYDVANVGSMQDVRIVSGDGEGVYGLGIFNTSGMGYVKRVEVSGFDQGVSVEGTVNNIVFEHIYLHGQRDVAIYNEGKIISFRGLTVRGEVPVLRSEKSQAAAFILELDALGKGQKAFELEKPSFLYLRDASVLGYFVEKPHNSGLDNYQIPQGQIDEWWSHGPAERDKIASLHLRIRDAPEFSEGDLEKWISVTAFGAIPNDTTDDAAAIQRAIDAAEKSEDITTVYFPYGVYRVESEVFVGDGVRKLEFMHSKVMGSRDEAGARIRVRQSSNQTLNIENVVRYTPILHDSDGTVVVRNHAGNYGANIETSARATGNFFAENIGPHAEISIGNGIHAWLRAINRETSPFTNNGAVAWFYGDNIETMVRKHGSRKIRRRVGPILTQDGGVTEYLAGCLDILHHQHEIDDGALFVTIDSTLSAIGAGEVRKKRGRIGLWPYIARSVFEGKETRLLDEDVIYIDDGQNDFPKRWLMPMYRVQPQ